MPHLICYDISNNSLRTKLGKRIIDKGFDRINKSVYLGNINDTQITNLERELALLIQQKGGNDDSLIFIPVTIQQIHNIRVYGKNELDKEELTGEKSTLII